MNFDGCAVNSDIVVQSNGHWCAAARNCGLILYSASYRVRWRDGKNPGIVVDIFKIVIKGRISYYYLKPQSTTLIFTSRAQFTGIDIISNLTDLCC